MTKDLSKTKGTIAKVLTDHQKELFDLIEKGDIQGSKNLCLSLLESDSLKSNPAIQDAKIRISRLNGNRYLSTLMTYMTGMKVS